MLFSKTVSTAAALFLITSVSMAQDPSDPERARVSSKALGEMTFYPAFSAPAKVISLNDSKISALINAQINSIAVRVGDTVKKGDTLVSLDCSDSRLARSAALSRRELAQKEFNRLSKLRKASAVTEQSLNAAETDLSQARITFRQAELQVSRCNVVAPFNGVVTDRFASEGELAATGTPLLSLTDTDAVEIIAQIPPADSSTLRNAGKTFYEWNNRKYPVSVRSLSPVINQLNRNREIRLQFNNQKALSGSAGRIQWQSKVAHLPADLLLERDGKTGVFIVDDNTARFIEIPTARAGQPAAVDLPDNTPVITDGRFGLQDGDLLDVKEL